MITLEHNPNNLPSAEANRWRPVLKGEVFCSPACGAKCKKADYDRVVEAANLLINKLGEGWEPDIWENGGWYYSITKGNVKVSPYGDTFTAQLKADYISEGHVLLIQQTEADPRLAVGNLVLKLSEIITRLSRAKASMALELDAVK